MGIPVYQVIDLVMTGEPNGLVIVGVSIALIIAMIVFLRRRLRLFDPLEPPREKRRPADPHLTFRHDRPPLCRNVTAPDTSATKT